jgi:hypothetical protein
MKISLNCSGKFKKYGDELKMAMGYQQWRITSKTQK